VTSATTDGRSSQRLLGYAIALYAALSAAGFWVLGSATDRQTWIVFLTGGALLWYSWETMLLRKTAASQLDAMERQRDLMAQQLETAEGQRAATLRQVETAIRPYIILEASHRPFVLKNIGTGPALNVVVHPVTLPRADGVTLRFTPKVLPHFPSNSTAQLEVLAYQGEKVLGDLLAAHLNPAYTEFTLPIRITFENVEGRPYEVEHKITPGQIQLVGLNPHA
jgi:hypothetical protein